MIIVGNIYAGLNSGTSLTANNGLTITAGVVQLGGALVQNTHITNGAFNFTIDQVTVGLIDLTGQLIQPTAFVPTPGLQPNDILLLGGMTMYMSNAVSRYFSQYFNNSDQFLENIVSTGGPFYQWQFNGVSQMGLSFIAGNNSFLFIGSGAGQGSFPRGVTNGDIWQRVGGGIFSQVTGANDYAGYIPSSANISSFFNTGASGSYRWYVSKGTVGSANLAMVMSVNGRIRVSSTGLTTEIPTSRFTVDSTTEGTLPPRMTNAQMLAISPPAAADGLRVYNTTFGAHYYWNNGVGAWQAFATAPVPGATPPVVVATGQIQLQTASANVLTFNVPNTGSGFCYRVNLQVFVLSFTGVPTLNCTVSYQDELNTAATVIFFSMGAGPTTPGIQPGQTTSQFPPAVIVCYPGSTISIDVTLSGAGATINYNSTGFVELIF